MKPKGTRVWVAVDGVGEPLVDYSARTKRFVVNALDDNFLTLDWRKDGITIRRATLVLDPVKKRARRTA